MDYDYVASHGSYQVLLLQALRSAQRRGARRVLYGMSADLQKSRFGARPEKRWAYVQATDTFNAAATLHSTLMDGTLRADSICASIARDTPDARANASSDN